VDANTTIQFEGPWLGFRSSYLYTQLYTSDKNLGQINKVDIEFGVRLFGRLIEHKIDIEKIDINFMSNIDEK